jgi:predicted DNA binding CopG/RHH family protein
MNEAHEHCRHCPGPGDPRHADPAFAKAEADCAFYEHPENLAITGPAHKRKSETRRRTAMVSVRFTVAELAAVQARATEAGMLVSTYIRSLALGRPVGLIPGSGRPGEPKALGAMLARTSGAAGQTFSCPHMSIGGVVSASCGICGPLGAVA